MPVSLSKGQKISLTKGNPGLKKVVVGLGWDTNAFDTGSAFDIDSSAFLLTDAGKVSKPEDFVFYGNLNHPSGAVSHCGDNLTGAGDGDDEQIMVDISRLPSNVGKVVFTVNIYDARTKGQHFGLIENAFIRLVNMDNNQEICRYNLSENYNNMTGLVVGEIYRKGNEWKFNAIGQAVKEASRLDAIISLYR